MLTEPAEPAPLLSYFEQGMGLLRPHATAVAMRDFTPHLSVLPPALDLTSGADGGAGGAGAGGATGGGAGGGGAGGGAGGGPGGGAGGCTFFWPHCAQPLYAGARPVENTPRLYRP